MPVNVYEGMFLLDSNKAATSWEEAEQQTHDLLRKHGSEIVASRLWVERRLAYPIKVHKKGTYLLTYFKAESSAITPIVGDCRISELIVRELILKVHPKLSEPLVAQAMSFTPTDESVGGPNEEGGERRRRRDRDD